MKVRHAAVAAGLALGVVSGSARAATLPIKYNVDLTLYGGHKVTGFIETDGIIGNVHRKDIVDIYLKSGQTFITQADLNQGNTFLEANAEQLIFFAGQSFFNIDGENGVVLSHDFSDYSVLDFSYDSYVFPGGYGFRLDGVSIPRSTDYVIGTVPLPASAPMFGALSSPSLVSVTA